MDHNEFLLYGANGYTGRLIARMAGEYGLRPILAGRNEEVLASMAKELNLPYRVASLDNTDSLDAALKGLKLVVHAAGPFKYTARPMIEACIRNGVHYTDITGEIMVYEMAKKYQEKAAAANVMVMPGVGFDVVPTDCLALYLKHMLPDATHLKLAFASIGGRLSHGTATTMAEGKGGPSAVRINGKITPVPLGQKGMWVDFGPKKLFVMTIPWGDVSTAYSTTGIPNIETYTGVSPKTFKLLKYQGLFNWLLRTSFMRKKEMEKIKNAPAGPSDEERAKAKSLVWGEVTNAEGRSFIARLTGPEGYTMTAHTALTIAKKILEGNVKPGYQTPAGCYGCDLVLEVAGTKRENVTP